MLIKLKPDMPNNNDVVLVVCERKNDGKHYLDSAIYLTEEDGDIGRFYLVYIDRVSPTIPTIKAATNEFENVIGWAPYIDLEINDDGKYEFDGA